MQEIDVIDDSLFAFLDFVSKGDNSDSSSEVHLLSLRSLEFYLCLLV